MQSFSKRLTKLRKERDLTQAECAKLNHLQRSTYAGYEIEDKTPSFETLCLLANFFGVTTDYLLGISNVRTHNDAVFINNSNNFVERYEKLPNELKPLVLSSFDAFYSLLSHDMMQKNQERLKLYAELFSLIEKKRANIRTSIEGNTGSDPLFISTLMTEQTTFKNEVSGVLDRLMQTDLGNAAQKPSHALTKKSAM
ncbi:MAG: helix-turn-helix domain-containing protein [Clostridiales bacterium]|nr:helix-turn-helix domain-containing protein [Clostridiales bacterium]